MGHIKPCLFVILEQGNQEQIDLKGQPCQDAWPKPVTDRVLLPWRVGWGSLSILISFRHESEQRTEKRLERNMPELLTDLTSIWC